MYINTNYKPQITDVIATYKGSPKEGTAFEEAASFVASEASIGPWNYFWRANEEVGTPLRPKITRINPEAKTFTICFPETLFEPANLGQILSVLAGNVLSMSILNNIELVDFKLSKELEESFSAPAFGIKNIRELMQIHHRPLCGVMMKPKIGLDPESYAKLAHELWTGGIDIIQDAETLTNQISNPFEERLETTLQAKKEAERESREMKLYAPNVSGPDVQTTLKRVEMAAQKGSEAILINPLLLGWPACATITRAARESGMIVIATRTGHASITFPPRCISPTAMAKCYRYSGIDISQIPNPTSKSNRKRSQLAFRTLTNHPVKIEDDQHIMKTHSHNKALLPSISGGIHPGLVEPSTTHLDNDILLIASEGVFYHPKGVLAGAKALRQACDAVGQHVGVQQYAKSHPELQIALEKWG